MISGSPLVGNMVSVAAGLRYLMSSQRLKRAGLDASQMRVSPRLCDGLRFPAVAYTLHTVSGED